MKSKPTPGPWCANDRRVESLFDHGVVNDGWIIAECQGPDAKANAASIAARRNKGMGPQMTALVEKVRDENRTLRKANRRMQLALRRARAASVVSAAWHDYCQCGNGRTCLPCATLQKIDAALNLSLEMSRHARLHAGEGDDVGVLTELHLFAGAGGGVQASLLLGHRIVCLVEREAARVEILKARMRDGILPECPVWDDATTFAGGPWRGVVDLVSGGVPCSPFSCAGKQRGSTDERNLWPATLRIVGEVLPAECFFENVPGLLAVRESQHGGLDYPEYAPGFLSGILGSLAGMGYDCRWTRLSAAALGATHKRDRLWIYGRRVGDRDGAPENARPAEGGPVQQWGSREGGAESVGGGEGLADAERLRGERRGGTGIVLREGGDAEGEARERERSRDAARCGGHGVAATGLPLWPPGPADLAEWRRILNGGGSALAPAVETPPRSRVRGVAHGVGAGVDLPRTARLSALGDGQVPVVAAAAFLYLSGRGAP